MTVKGIETKIRQLIPVILVQLKKQKLRTCQVLDFLLTV